MPNTTSAFENARRPFRKTWLGVLALLLTVAANLGPVAAHEIKPAVVTIKEVQDPAAAGTPLDITIKLNLEAIIAKVGPEHTDSETSPQADVYNALRKLPPAELEPRFREFAATWLDGITIKLDGKRIAPSLDRIEIPEVGDTSVARTSTAHLKLPATATGSKLEWGYDASFGTNIFRVYTQAQDAPITGFLRGGMSRAIDLSKPQDQSRWETVWDYIVLGFTHIVPKGLDHILFVIGIYLLSTHWRPLLAQVTAFTVAHTITLALGLYGIVNLSPNIVEPLIALSIAYVAIENIMTSKLHAWRTAIVFAFGLLHGLGFAGILKEVGLPEAQYVTGLISFNVGVELGQLAVIAVAWLATGVWFSDKSWYRSRIVIPASIAIAATGLYWTWERIFAGGIG